MPCSPLLRLTFCWPVSSFFCLNELLFALLFHIQGRCCQIDRIQELGYPFRRLREFRMSLEDQLQNALGQYRYDAAIYRNARARYKKKLIGKLTSPPAFIGAFAFGFITTARSSVRSRDELQRASKPLSRWQRLQHLRHSLLKTYGAWLAVRTTLAMHLNSSFRANEL